MIRWTMSLLLLTTLPLCASESFELAELQAAATHDRFLRIPFVQSKQLALFPEPVETAGVLEIARPLAAVRWEFTGRSTLILRDGGTRRWASDGSEESVGAGPAAEALAAQMGALLSGDWSGLDELFTIEASRIDGRPQLTLTARGADLPRHITAIDIVFQDDLSAPARLVIRAPGGDETSYTFARSERPDTIAAERFDGP